MIRHLNTETLDEIRILSQSSVTLYVQGDASAPPDARTILRVGTPKDPYSVTIMGKEATYALYTVTDASGKPVAVLRSRVDSSIMAEAEATINTYTAYLLGIGLAFSAFTVLVADRLLFRPVSELSQKVDEIGSGGDFAMRLKGSDDSELGVLERDINVMLDRIEEARNREREAQKSSEELRRSHVNNLLDGARKISASLRFDLRSPLQVIKNASYLLRQDPTRAEETLDMIDRSVEKSVTILEDLNSKTNLGDLKQTFGDVKQLIDQAERTARIPDRIRVEKSVKDEFLAVRIDVDRFERVLLNVISNAVDAIPDNGTITIQARRQENQIEISVQDDGVGIPPENMRRLFQPFFSTKPGGTGLGLVYSREVLEAHGGSIKVESTPGKGTKVTMVLPFRERQ